MKKIILAALVVASLFASCSSENTFKKKDGSTITAKPYGWASKENKVEGVNYELNAPDVVASIMFFICNGISSYAVFCFASNVFHTFLTILHIQSLPLIQSNNIAIKASITISTDTAVNA